MYFSYFHTLRVCTIPTYTESTDSMITINSDGHHQISLLHVQRPGNIDSEVSETSNTYHFSIIYWRRLLIRSWLDAILESEWTNFCSFLQQSTHYFHIARITSWVKGGGLQMIRFGQSQSGVRQSQCDFTNASNVRHYIINTILHQCMTLHHQHFFVLHIPSI